MAYITTGIQLADNFSAPLMHIISSVNMAISSIYDMNQAMNSGVDTTSLEAARNEIAQATVAAEEFNQTMQQASSPINDNIRRQEQFNQSLQNGASESSNLVSAIKRMAGAYLSIQTAGKILQTSDEITQTTSRLNMMNDGLQSTADLYNMVYVAANDARGSLGDMASVVARFGNNAKDAFSSSAEVVQFANLVQKQMTIAGASTQEAANAELQLSQALGSGVLRGDELNSIFEQAPNLIQNIADYLDVPIGKIRSMAQDGELSANVVKQAVFAATDEINANFESMPMTWGQMWTVFQNNATMAFQPVLQRLNDLANTDGFQTFTTNAINDLAVVAGVVLDIFEGIGSIGTFVHDYDVEVVNANLKKIDEQMKTRENATDALQEPEFTVADKRENIASKEKMPKILGKIAKFFTDLKTVAFSGKYSDLDGKPAIVNNNTATEAGSALDARQANPTIEGTMANQILQLNNDLKSLFNTNLLLVDALDLQNQPGIYLTNNTTKNLPDNCDYGLLFIVYGSENKWRFLIFITTALDGIYLKFYNGYVDLANGWSSWHKIS